MTFRRIAVCVFALIGVLAALGAGALTAVGRFDFGPSLSRYASRYLGRPILVGTLRVRMTPAVTVELRDVAVDNVAGGSRPRLLQIARLDVELAPWSLLAWAVEGQPPVIRHLAIDGVSLLIEHGADDRPNWQFGERGPGTPAHGNRRGDLPGLLDAGLRDAEIDIRTSSGQILRIHIDEARSATTGLDQPVTVTATGAYNGTPVRVAGTLHSLAELHDPAVPFGVDIHLASADTTVDFTGTLTDPLHADGCDGRLTLSAPNEDQILAVTSIGGRAALPLALAGDFTRQGDLWRLSDGRGTLRNHPFQINLDMQEGARRAPDDITVDAGFSVLDLTGLASGGKFGAMPLHVDDAPGTLLDAHVTAGEFAFGPVRAKDVELKLKLAPGALSVEHLALHLAGGTMQATAAAKNTTSGAAALQLDGTLTGADAGQLSRLLGFGPMPLAGAVDAHASVGLAGNTFGDAARSNRGVVVLSMQGGSIQHKVDELLSTDLRMLFGTTEGTVRIACFLGVLDLHDGIGRVAPLRIRTADGTIAAGGTIDLLREVLDLTVASEAASTSFFALDVPIRIAGPMRDPHVLPAAGGAGRAANAGTDPRSLPAALQDLVRRNPCLTGRRS